MTLIKPPRGELYSRIAQSFSSLTGRTSGLPSNDELGELTNRFANVLERLGIAKGDVVVTSRDASPMKYGTHMPRQHDLGSLRFLASVGEPLNPEAVVWGVDAFGLPTTTGGRPKRAAS